MAFGRRNRLRRKKKKNLQSGGTSSTTSRRGILGILKRRKRQKNQAKNNKQKTNTKNYRDNSSGRNKRVKQSNLRTSGGEFTLDGKPYIGSYHIMSDGRAMVGKRHSIFRRKKYLEPVTQTTPPPTTTPSIPTSRYQKPNIKIPPKPAKTPLTGVINPPYKELASFANQYPATDTEVKEAANTDITTYYSGGSVRGHRGARETISLSQPGVQSATVRSELNINFVVNLDGTNYTSSQLSNKIGRARGEGNWYYINSIPVINFNSSEIPPLSGNLFKAEEDYAFNSPTNQVDDLSEKLNVIDWTCRKQAQVEQPLPYKGRYDDSSTVASRITIDEIIASAKKPPKIRWRTSR
mgnify:FL=1